MALITLGAMVTDITGSIGGTTFQNTKAGLIARNKPMARKSATEAQSLARQFPSRFIPDWTALTLADQLAWNVYATAHPHVNRFGETKLWSGFNCFESTNYNFVRVGTAEVTAPPTFFGAESVDDFTVFLDSTQIRVDFNAATTPVNSKFVVWGTYIIGSAYTSNRSRYRQLVVLEYGGGVVNFDVTTQWQDVFGLDWSAIAAGSFVKLILGVQNVNFKDGTASAILFRSGEFTF